MTEKEFNSFITIKIQGLVNVIISKKKVSFEEAVAYLYKSETYQYLIAEETKTWHLSEQKLFEILVSEYETKQCKLPDYV